MSRATPALGLLLLAAAALVMWVGGLGPFAPAQTQATDPSGGERALLDGGGADEADPADGASAERRPHLFAGPGARRPGKGVVLAKVVDYTTGEAMEGVRLEVVGTGFDEEKVHATATSTKEGALHIADVPAGEGYEAVLHAPLRDPARIVLPAFDVRAGDVADLGIVWWGKRSALRGIVRDESARPVEGAQIGVYPAGSQLRQDEPDIVEIIRNLDRDPEPIAATESGEDGRFAFAQVRTGPLTLVVRKDGYFVGTYTLVMSETGAVGGDPDVRLRPMEPITGRVIDEKGRGVEGARIAFEAQGDDLDGFIERKFVHTDRDGRFEVRSAPRVDRWLTITAAPGYPRLHRRIEAGERDLTFTLVAGANLRLTLRELGTTRPIPDATVSLFMEDGEAKRGGAFSLGVTDVNGVVELVGRPGRVQAALIAQAEYGTGLYVPGDSRDAYRWVHGPKKISLKAGKTTEATFEIAAAVTLTGRVLDPDGNPVAGVQVLRSGDTQHMERVRTVSDGAGRYSIPCRARMKNEITLIAPGFARATYVLKEQYEANAVVEKDLKLLTAALVVGKVLDATGRPLAGARVKLTFLRRRETGQVLTNQDGMYRVENVVPDYSPFRAVAVRTGYLAARSDQFKTAAGEVTEAPVLRLKKGRTVAVRVLTPGGRPVRAARVHVKIDAKDEVRFDGGGRQPKQDRTGADGRVVFHDLHPGKLTVAAAADGYAVEVEQATLAGENLDIETRLRRANDLRGIVTQSDGKRVKGAKVTVRHTGRPGEKAFIPVTVRTNDKGEYEASGIPDVEVAVYVRTNRHRARTVTARGNDGHADVVLEPAPPEVLARIKQIDNELKSLKKRAKADKLGKEVFKPLTDERARILKENGIRTD